MPFDERFESVLAAAKAASDWAITDLYRELQPSVLRYLQAQSPGNGEDLASDVWVDVAAGLGRFEGDEAGFRRWLFTIARRRLVDFRRSDGRRLAVLSRLKSSIDGPVGDLEAQVLAASETEVALARLAALPPDQAEVVLLRVLGGLDVQDVAAIVGKKPGAVRVLQHRALKRLERELARERMKVDVTE
jgi:RNA polymerase sigma-70 factor (ECF subfamily)